MSTATVIGQKIKRLREMRKISRENLCNEVGITQSAISMYENGQRIPRDEIKVKLARALGVSIEELFFTE